jgi:hypothetical protein
LAPVDLRTSGCTLPCAIVPSHSAGRSWSLRRTLGLLLVVLLVLVGWLGLRALQVRSSLLEARSVLSIGTQDVVDGDLAGLRSAQQAASGELGAARTAVDDPVWRVASAVPLLGRSFSVTREATLATQEVVDDVLAPLLESGTALQDGDLLSGGRIDLDLVRDLAVSVGRAETAAQRAQARVAGTSDSLLPAVVADGRQELLEQVDQLASALGTASPLVDAAPAMLGAEGPRRYFLAVQNNTESRATGGLIGAYAILVADQGQLSLERAGTNKDFENADEPVVDMGPEFSELYDRFLARTFWPAAVVTPHWPSASRIVKALWEAQGGDTIDAVLSVDPLAMAEILAVTGPAELDGQRIGADNVVDFVMVDEYVEYADDNAARKDVLGELATVLYEKVSSGGFPPQAMLAALGRAGASGHLHLWSAQPAEQALLSPLRVAAELPGTPGAYLHVASNNAAANKIDYYIRRKVSYERTGTGSAVATVELTNTVVPQGLPPVVTLRTDDPPPDAEPGQTSQLISVFVGHGQLVERVLVDGVEVGALIGTEQGHGVAIVRVEIRPSRPTVVTAEITDPGGTLTYRQQPLVVDDELAIGVPFVVG